MRLSELCNEGYSGVLILCDVYTISKITREI